MHKFVAVHSQCQFSLNSIMVRRKKMWNIWVASTLSKSKMWPCFTIHQCKITEGQEKGMRVTINVQNKKHHCGGTLFSEISFLQFSMTMPTWFFMMSSCICSALCDAIASDRNNTHYWLNLKMNWGKIIAWRCSLESKACASGTKLPLGKKAPIEDIEDCGILEWIKP